MPPPDPDFTRYRTTGDEAAFQALVAAHVGMVHAVAARRLGPHAHLSADVAQAVFSRLARVAGTLPADLLPAPWLHRQAVRLAIDTVRREERRLARETAAAMLYSSGDQEASAAAVLDEALDRLPAADRSLLVLRYLEDQDFSAVAAALGSTPEAARKRIARSLGKLRALLERRGVVLTTAALTAFLTEQASRAAPAALALRISATALQTSGAGQTGFLLTTVLMSHLAAISAGAIAALLACGLFYQYREDEIERAATFNNVNMAAKSAGSSVSPLSGQSGEDAPLPSTLPEIIAAVGQLTAGPQHRLTQERIAALLRRVPPEQYLEFLITAESRIHPVRWASVVGQATHLWKDTDPAALTRALFDSDNRKGTLIGETALHGNMAFNSFEIASTRSGSSMSLRIRGPFEKWLALDAAAARQWMQDTAGEPLMKMPWMFGETLGRELSDSMVKRLPSGGPLEDLPAEDLDPRGRTLLRQRWADGVIDRAGDFGKALTVSATSADEARLLAQYCAKRDPAACRQAIAGMPDESLRFSAALGFVSQYLIEDETSSTSLDANERLPRAQFAFGLAGQRSVSESLREIVQACLEPEGRDTDEVRQWVLRTGGAEAGEALAAGARRLAGQTWSMKTAMEWADAIPDAVQRGPLLRGIFQRWSDNAPEAAAKYLETAAPALAAQLDPWSELP